MFCLYDKRTLQHRGTTLFETVFYIGLFAFVAIFVITALIASFRLFYTISLDHTIATSARTAMEVMSREIQSADSIDVSNSTFDSSPGVLVLDATDSSDVAYEATFDVSGGSLRMSIDGASIGSLITDDVEVTSLIFRRITTTNNTEGIRIELTIEGTQYNRTRTESFTTTVLVRKSY